MTCLCDFMCSISLMQLFIYAVQNSGHSSQIPILTTENLEPDLGFEK